MVGFAEDLVEEVRTGRKKKPIRQDKIPLEERGVPIKTLSKLTGKQIMMWNRRNLGNVRTKKVI